MQSGHVPDPDGTSAVAELKNYVEKTEKWLDGFMASIGWTEDHIAKSENKVPCRVKPSHFIPVSKLHVHEEKCNIISRGYSKEDLDVDQSSDYFYESATTVVPIKLEPSTLANLLSNLRMRNVNEDDLPQTVERYFQELSVSERLKVYEYCVETARQVSRVSQISGEEELMLLGQTSNKEGSGPKSRLEMLAEERDYKRRRQSYKGKSVHTGKKSHLQVVREVIESQMEFLKSSMMKPEDTETQREKTGERREDGQSERTNQRENAEVEKMEHSRSERSRSRSRDVKRKKKHHRRSRSKSRSRDRERSHSRHRKHKKKKHKEK